MEKIGVTAASGQLGAAIVKELIKQIGKEQVVGIARTPEKAAHLGVEVRKGDYSRRDDFETALAGLDKVLIVSGNTKPKDRIPQHRNIIQAAVSQGLSKIVYTSILGNPNESEFSPIISSNRQTEEDVRNSGIAWSIGRNSIYIEPDLEYISHYKKAGEIANSAGEGRTTYISRPELALAYAHMLLEDKHNGQTYNLAGHPITQSELVEVLNQVYGTTLIYRPMSVAAYYEERKAELGPFLGTVIGGIYEGISKGAMDVPSDFEKATGRPPLTALEMARDYLSDS
ncbi:MAG: SDR family oxidoreductase [Bacteroidota bacterium]